MDLKKIKFKTGTAAIYVLALMLVGFGIMYQQNQIISKQ